MKRSAQFDKELVEQLPSLRRRALYLTKNQDMAEDAVSTVIDRALRFSDHFKPGSSMRNWLHMILTNSIKTMWRDAKRDRAMNAQYASRLTSIATDNQHATIELKETMVIINRIDRPNRDVFLSFVAGSQYEECSTDHKVPVGTVKSTVARWREKVREMT